jgi:hypothetical protein
LIELNIFREGTILEQARGGVKEKTKLAVEFEGSDLEVRDQI